jgi:hypothetical protein
MYRHRRPAAEGKMSIREMISLSITKFLLPKRSRPNVGASSRSFAQGPQCSRQGVLDAMPA